MSKQTNPDGFEVLYTGLGSLPISFPINKADLRTHSAQVASDGTEQGLALAAPIHMTGGVRRVRKQGWGSSVSADHCSTLGLSH